jgi:hypothetical protein
MEFNINILPSGTELAFRCFTLYLDRNNQEENDLLSLIERAELLKEKFSSSAVVELNEKVRMKVSMNINDTIFVKFIQKNYRDADNELIEFYYNKDKILLLKELLIVLVILLYLR